MIMPTKCKDCLKRINKEHQLELDNKEKDFVNRWYSLERELKKEIEHGKKHKGN